MSLFPGPPPGSFPGRTFFHPSFPPYGLRDGWKGGQAAVGGGGRRDREVGQITGWNSPAKYFMAERPQPWRCHFLPCGDWTSAHGAVRSLPAGRVE